MDIGREGLSWCLPAGSAPVVGYDVVRGDLASLRATAGDFSVATLECVADGWIETALSDASCPDLDAGCWFLVRYQALASVGSYDSGSTSQVHSRDFEIRQSSGACP